MLPPLLDELLRAHGPAGHEQLAHDVVRAAAGGLGEATSDAVGNLVVRPDRSGRPLLALLAHLDVVGLAVSHVADDGRLGVHKLGVWKASVAYGQRVEIRTRNGPVEGVLARTSKGDEKVEWDELRVDIGARDGEEARRLVAPGDPLVVLAPPVELAGGRVASRSLDNRACVYIALEALRRLAGEELAVDVALVAGAQEELGGAGVRAALHALQPDVAVALDVTYATDVPPTDPAEAGDHRLGGGPAIFRGPTITPKVFELLVEAAEAEELAYTIETGMKTFTDADHAYGALGGIPTGLVSVPLRYMHSPIELVDLADLEAAVRLVVGFARRLGPDTSWARV